MILTHLTLLTLTKPRAKMPLPPPTVPIKKTKKTSSNLPTSGNTKEWLREIKNNKSLTKKKQKSNLIFIHNSYKVIERNNSILHQLKTSINKKLLKIQTIHFTTTSSNKNSELPIISTTITTLEENKTLSTTITNFKVPLRREIG